MARRAIGLLLVCACTVLCACAQSPKPEPLCRTGRCENPGDGSTTGDTDIAGGDDTVLGSDDDTGDTTLPGGDDAIGGGDDTPVGPLETTVLVHYDVGYGNTLHLRGDDAGLNWSTGMPCTWGAGNVWSCVLEGGDGAIALKPLHNDSTWARGWNWRVIAGQSLDIYPYFFSNGGSVEIIRDVASTILGNTRDVAVYLPPSYTENPLQSYPILFMQDGQNLFDPSTSFLGVAWEIDGAIDELAAWAGIQEAIVVGPYNSADRTWEYNATDAGAPAGADDYLDFLLDELRPIIQSRYRTVAPSSRVGIAGSSFGGNLTLYACWSRPEVFDKCGIFSPALWWDDDALLDMVAADPHGQSIKQLRIYLDSGDSGTSNDGMVRTAELRDLLLAKGWRMDRDFMYVLGEGDAHNETAWQRRAPAALEFLLADPRRAP
jgi:predicted alpha/beta superfamily hydrolase